MKQALLDVRHLKTYFYMTSGVVRAVDDVSIEVRHREIVGLVGESGCGKTTLGLSITRLVPPPGKIVAGKILLERVNLLDLTEREIMKIRGGEISMVFQDPMTFLNPVMNVGDQVVEAISLHQKGSKIEHKKKALEMLERVRISSAKEVMNYYPHQLSGGMRQRVLIAMALSCNPSLVIADEPTTAVDVTTQKQILNLMKELTTEFEASWLIITHDLGVIAEICDKLYIMYAGKIVEHGEIFEVFDGPKHPYTKALLSSALSIDEFKEELTVLDGVVPDLLNPPTGCRFHPRCHQRMQICSQQQPPSVEITKQHRVSCWLYD